MRPRRDYLTRMPKRKGRLQNPPPPGACDACARRCNTLGEVGIRCYHCGAGVFMGARWWDFTEDEEGKWIATPRDDIELAELAAERARLEEDARKQHRSLPPWG